MRPSPVSGSQFSRYWHFAAARQKARAIRRARTVSPAARRPSTTSIVDGGTRYQHPASVLGRVEHAAGSRRHLHPEPGLPPADQHGLGIPQAELHQPAALRTHAQNCGFRADAAPPLASAFQRIQPEQLVGTNAGLPVTRAQVQSLTDRVVVQILRESQVRPMAAEWGQGGVYLQHGCLLPVRSHMGSRRTGSRLG